MTVTTDHDVIGIGLGPFNLGLAALLDGVEGVSATFFDARPEFSWHPGLLLDGASLQVPFLADLVTLADPTSPHSFLNYLHQHDRLFRFYFYEDSHVPRREFDRYCRWVADRVPGCRFDHRVVGVAPSPQGDGWLVKVEQPGGEVVEHRARAVVAGVGTRPWVPACAADALDDATFHAAGYVPNRDRARAVLGAGGRVTVIGSGQSAAEVFADLLDALPDPAATTDPAGLAWFTRSRGFFPMEYSKLGLEHFTPEYTRWFHGLAEPVRDELRRGQDLLYKGISFDTGNAIYDALYERTVDQADAGASYAAGFEVVRVEPVTGPSGDRRRVHLRHVDDGSELTHDTDLVVLATGYEPTPLPLEDPALIARDRQGRPAITLDYRVRLADGSASDLFVQNGELHTHGVGAPDLGLGARRNAVIINQLTGREVYRVPERTVFQRFGAQVADDLADPGTAS